MKTIKTTEDKILEEQFQNFPLKTPSELVLKRVRENAMRFTKPSLKERFLNFKLLNIPLPRTLAWTTMIFIVVGLSYGLKEMRKTDVYTIDVTHQVTTTKKAIQSNSKLGTRVAKEENTTAVTSLGNQTTPTQNQPANLNTNYTQAIGLFHQNNFQNASLIFENIMTTNPRFEKRVELYTYWIQSLEKLGEIDLANAKKNELERIKRGEK